MGRSNRRYRRLVLSPPHLPASRNHDSSPPRDAEPAALDLNSELPASSAATVADNSSSIPRGTPRTPPAASRNTLPTSPQQSQEPGTLPGPSSGACTSTSSCPAPPATFTRTVPAGTPASRRATMSDVSDSVGSPATSLPARSASAPPCLPTSATTYEPTEPMVPQTPWRAPWNPVETPSSGIRIPPSGALEISKTHPLAVGSASPAKSTTDLAQSQTPAPRGAAGPNPIAPPPEVWSGPPAAPTLSPWLASWIRNAYPTDDTKFDGACKWYEQAIGAMRRMKEGDVLTCGPGGIVVVSWEGAMATSSGEGSGGEIAQNGLGMGAGSAPPIPADAGEGVGDDNSGAQELRDQDFGKDGEGKNENDGAA